MNALFGPLVIHGKDCPALCDKPKPYGPVCNEPAWKPYHCAHEVHACTCSAPSGRQLAELGAAAVEAWAIIEGLGVYAEIEERLRKALLPFRAPKGDALP